MTVGGQAPLTSEQHAPLPGPIQRAQHQIHSLYTVAGLHAAKADVHRRRSIAQETDQVVGRAPAIWAVEESVPGDVDVLSPIGGPVYDVTAKAIAHWRLSPAQPGGIAQAARWQP